ncbi:hypothetical protein [Burkholderia multivorans]|uniref:hypothetical protein n=1 Tax=Burkholderia multivorans TaxID=87883 RepID=UPI001C24E65B|nr:hypothetical protein [Burkholderia multivorans]MBU9478027.1 hypothetical protein [Burkholderia multivorans]
MARSALFGRRVHITGSISGDLALASADEVRRARAIVESLVKELIRKGATFVIPVDAEKLREDGLPICFDWLVWETVHKHLHARPEGTPNPLVIAVKHHKTETQIPEQYAALWSSLRGSPMIQIESAALWNMNSKRMEMQARHGDMLITLGGGEGVLFLANIYHDAGKPVIPLNLKLGSPQSGSLRLFDFGLAGNNAKRLFQTDTALSSHGWLNRIEMPSRQAVPESVDDLMALIEALAPPKAFVVRLLNPEHEDFNDVQAFFDTVVQPVIEDELRYKMAVIDGYQAFDHARIDQEIFAKLHRSSIVLADITGSRPNCFLELGYALGRGLPTMLMAKAGTAHPFDITTFSGHHWKTTGSVEERRRELRKHWEAVRNRPTLVPTEPLIP